MSDEEKMKEVAKAKAFSDWYKKFESEDVTELEFEVEQKEREWDEEDEEVDTFNVNVYKEGGNGDWVSTDGDRYHEYLTPEDILRDLQHKYESAWLVEIDGKTQDEFVEERADDIFYEMKQGTDLLCAKDKNKYPKGVDIV